MTDRIRTACAVLLFLCAAFPASTWATGENRVALVIGNSAYSTAGLVPTATRNAALMARELRQLGFAVRQDTNLGQSAMVESLRTFVRTARLADIALIYYAGHAVTLDGQSYLVPTDVRASSLASARVELIALTSLIEQLGRNGNRNVLLLEAGQQNAYVRQLGRRLSQGSVRALRSSLELPRQTTGVIVAGAQEPGRLYDDPSPRRTSRWTGAIIEALRQPGLRFTEVLDQAAKQVVELSDGSQNAWQVVGDEAPLRLNGAPLVAPKGAGDDPSQRAWEELRGSHVMEEFEAFVESYPRSPLTSSAMQRLLWLRSLDSNERDRMVNLTRRKRFLERELRRTRNELNGIIKGLSTSGYRAEPILAQMVATGDVSLRDKPSGGGTWLGLVREGTVRRVEGSVQSGSWMMVELTPVEQRRLYDAVGRQVPSDGSAKRYGFVAASNLSLVQDQPLVIWRKGLETGKWASDPDALSQFIDQNPNFVRVSEAIDLLLRTRFSDDLDQPLNPADQGYVGDGQLRPSLDLSGDIPVGALATSAPADDAIAFIPEGDAPPEQSGPQIVRIPELGYSVEVFDEEFVTTTRSNLRRLPWVKTRKITTLPADERILVTGRVREVDWFRVRYGEGRDVYIFGELVEPFAGSALEAWQQIQKSQDPADIESYLVRFPEGPHVDRVREMLQSHRAVSGGRFGSGIVAPQLASANNVEGLDKRLINVFPIEYQGQVFRTATNQLIRNLGLASGAQVLSDASSSTPGMLMVLVDVIDLRTDRLARNTVLTDENANTEAGVEENAGPSGQGGRGDRASTHTTTAQVRVNLVDTRTGAILVGGGRDNSPIAGIRPSDAELERGVRRAIDRATTELVPQLSARY